MVADNNIFNICAKVTASDSLFGAGVLALDAAQSRAEYCWLPPGSSPVQRRHCLTGEALSRSIFMAVKPGAAGYAMPDRHTGAVLRRAASNGGELGAFNALRIPDHESLIENTLGDILPLGAKWDIVWL